MIANNWNDITVTQFMELQGLKNTLADSLAERYIDTILIVSDYEDEEVEDKSLGELSKIMKSLRWLDTQPSKKYAKKLGEYEFLPFKKITWGMFIDLEHYYKDYINNIPTICGILLRQVQENRWGVSEYEPYKYDPIKRGSVVSHLPITSVYGLITSYLDFRNDLISNKYTNLFENPETEEEPDLQGVDLKEYEKQMKAEQRHAKWSYESITYKLAGEDITKMNDILSLPLVYVLNMLSMQVDLHD